MVSYCQNMQIQLSVSRSWESLPEFLSLNLNHVPTCYQGHLYLHIKFKTSLGYKRFSFKTQNQKELTFEKGIKHTIELSHPNSPTAVLWFLQMQLSLWRAYTFLAPIHPEASNSNTREAILTPCPIQQNSLLPFFLFYFLRQGLALQPQMAWNSLCSLG